MNLLRIKIPLGFLAALTVLLLAAPSSNAAARAVTDVDPFYGVVSQQKLKDRDFDTMEWGRIGFYRLPVDWESIEPTGDGSYHWDNVDDAVRATAERGIELMPTLYSSPSWLSYTSREMPLWSQYAINEWREMVAAIVNRYGTNGEFWAENPDVPEQPVTLWQIWNEPNIRNWAKPVSPGLYGRLVRISAAVVRHADPKSKVVLGGLYGRPPPGTGIEAGPYLKRLYQVKGFRSSFDIAAVHPYATTTQKSLERTFPIRGVLNRHGDRRRPILITELGWGSDSATKFGYGTQEAQARQLSSAYRTLLKYRARLRLKAVVWFSWADVDINTHTCSFCQKTGFFDDKGDAKSSWWAFLDFTHGV